MTRYVFKEDFFERIVNVSWGGKLSVNIDKEGSETWGRAEAADQPGLDKGTMSIWFRMPLATLQAAYAVWADLAVADYTPDLVLAGIVPIVTWGDTNVVTSYTDQGNFGSQTIVWSQGPSFIGVYVGGFDDNGNPRFYPNLCNLALRFQSQNTSSVTIRDNDGKITFRRTEGNFFSVGFQDSQHEYGISIDDSDFLVTVQPDVWHHIAISYDITGAFGTLSISFDDEPIDGLKLWPCGGAALAVGGFGGGGDQSITAVYNWTFDPSQYDEVESGGFSAPTGGLGIPVPVDLTSYKYGDLQFAEFQFYDGKVVDFRDGAMRKLFITNGGKPEPVKTAEMALGKFSGNFGETKPKAQLQLHVDKNWMKGTNTGYWHSKFDHWDSGPGFPDPFHITPFDPQPALATPDPTAPPPPPPAEDALPASG